MKTVFDNRQCAHVWAQQTQEHGHSNNMRFDGDTIYSYRTPIARIVETVTGRKAALITSESYSVTTSSKHMPAVRRAVSHLSVFYVPCLGEFSGLSYQSREFGAKAHAANLAHFADLYAKAMERLKRARDLWQTPQQTLEPIADNARQYAEVFGLPVPAMPWDTDGLAIEAFRDERAARNNTPAKIAAKERAQERKRAKVREQFRAGAALRALAGTYGAQRALEGRMTAEDRDARAEALRVINADKIAAWLNGAPVSIRFDAACGGAALRIVGDTLETSHGARVPLAHAVKAFRFIKLVRERAEGWQHNGHSLRVGHFTVDSIAPDGSFKAGCHDIRWPEIERVAILAGVFDATPDDAALTLTHHAA